MLRPPIADEAGMQPLNTRKAKRLVTIAATGLALLVLAGVLVPDRSRATPRTGATPARGLASFGAASDIKPSQSTDPLEGLDSIGSLHQVGTTIRIVASEAGPLYSISTFDGREIASLLTAYEVDRQFPELGLGEIDFSTPTPTTFAPPLLLMHADPMGTAY
jgi:hypothetical protein